MLHGRAADSVEKVQETWKVVKKLSVAGKVEFFRPSPLMPCKHPMNVCDQLDPWLSFWGFYINGDYQTELRAASH